MSDLVCHVHVGMPKTGTTSIQETCSTIDLGHIRYLPFENNNHSPYIANLFENAPWKHRSNVQFARTKEEVIKRRRGLNRQLDTIMENAVQDPSVDGIMISGERLGTNGRSNAEAMGRFRDRFREWCGEFRIYGYVRPLASLLPSDFQQRLQIGGPAIFDLDWIYPHYRERFQKHDIVFGRPFVSLRRFVRGDLLEGDVVTDLLDQMNIPKPDLGRVETNVTMCKEATALLFALKRCGLFAGDDKDTSIALRSTSEMLKRLKGSKLTFDPAAVGQLLEKNKVDIRWIERRINASVSDFSANSIDPVRHAGDLLDIATDQRKRLTELEDVADQFPRAVHPSVLLEHLNKGLTTKAS